MFRFKMQWRVQIIRDFKDREKISHTIFYQKLLLHMR